MIYRFLLFIGTKSGTKILDFFCFSAISQIKFQFFFTSNCILPINSYCRKNFIDVTTVKTSDNLIIELNNHSKDIIEKYKDYFNKYNKAFPVITNQKMNDYLKELAEITEPIRETYYKGNERIDEVTPKHNLLSSHAGMRTFICNALALVSTSSCNEMHWT